ncbi:pyruvate phosphate dikinase [Micractinium conductrix]|uniref:Pyruvate, phosphate dikinase n=1 Tax=Micractinium conductrix TaxID=554055 RepID=A0A2P6VG98_9CHLO|nr:pyruvate phosphate dikinase [Micractinium conductrix]|eukprot:PSC73116.1 pyruvate phosphate dikinase [Micractinium conductrix]
MPGLVAAMTEKIQGALKKGEADKPAAETKNVYVFKKGSSGGRKEMKQLLGGKGANLCEMAHLGLNVPPAFTITTVVCQEFYKAGGKLPNGVWDDILSAVKEVEQAYGAKFADPADPLLFSVRSGAAVSMPGMMDTVLNLGLNDTVVKGLAKKRGERFAYDCYRRLLDMFGDVVLGIEHSLFEAEMHAVKEAKGIKLDVNLTGDDLKEVVRRFKGVYEKVGKSLPEDPFEQMKLAINAVFGSWNTPRAVKYREINRIRGLLGTAVNVQSMVYGNLNDNSGTGVCFTRNPATGEKKLYGEYLPNAQGEDVVAGIRTPLDVTHMAENFPEAYKDLVANTNMLEKHMRDMQDCEFTVQDGVLFMLQTRNGKRTGPAALQVAVAMEREGMVARDEAVLMVEPRHLDQLLHPMFEGTNKPEYKKAFLGKGLPASPGAAVGKVVFTADEAEKWHKEGEKVILVRLETSPEDVGGMHAAEGILTARGGMTSHAAVVARGWGKPCVCGLDKLEVDYPSKTATLGGTTLKEGDWLSLNGSSGEVLQGKQPVKPPEMSGELAVFMEWVDSFRKIGVFTNADTPADAIVARKNGAQGIGLVRTEHMFFATAERIAAVRRMIAAEELLEGEGSSAADALAALKEFQREDFEGIFTAMDGLPVTIRLLDPPLHEFLPHEGSPELDALCETLATEMQGRSGQHMSAVRILKSKIHGLQEANPMLGLRGCRLGIRHPDITEMQAKAILEAAVNVSAKGIKAHPHIMVPLVGFEEELANQVGVIRKAAEDTFKAKGATVEYKVGTMIEVPRGALRAGDLAKHADFFSFGTNDLTQMTCGFSRDDAEAKFLPLYVSQGIIQADPFEELDVTGVGELIKIAVQRGRETRPNLHLGICGEHGGDPKSIEFVSTLVDYVSCSPLRVPIARLAAAQAAIKQSKKHDALSHSQD